MLRLIALLSIALSFLSSAAHAEEIANPAWTAKDITTTSMRYKSYVNARNIANGRAAFWPNIPPADLAIATGCLHSPSSEYLACVERHGEAAAAAPPPEAKNTTPSYCGAPDAGVKKAIFENRTPKLVDQRIPPECYTKIIDASIPAGTEPGLMGAVFGTTATGSAKMWDFRYTLTRDRQYFLSSYQNESPIPMWQNEGSAPVFHRYAFSGQLIIKDGGEYQTRMDISTGPGHLHTACALSLLVEGQAVLSGTINPYSGAATAAKAITASVTLDPGAYDLTGTVACAVSANSEGDRGLAFTIELKPTNGQWTPAKIVVPIQPEQDFGSIARNNLSKAPSPIFREQVREFKVKPAQVSTSIIDDILTPPGTSINMSAYSEGKIHGGASYLPFDAPGAIGHEGTLTGILHAPADQAGKWVFALVLTRSDESSMINDGRCHAGLFIADKPVIPVSLTNNGEPITYAPHVLVGIADLSGGDQSIRIVAGCAPRLPALKIYARSPNASTWVPLDPASITPDQPTAKAEAPHQVLAIHHRDAGAASTPAPAEPTFVEPVQTQDEQVKEKPKKTPEPKKVQSIAPQH